jgi:Tfp pilus assembly protein PilX
MKLVHHTPFSSQRGATLVIGMIMLVLATLFVLAAINMSTTNLRVMGNEQARNEAIQAAQQAVEQVASIDFTKNPPTTASPTTVTVDINGDTTADYQATVTAACLNSVPVKVTELNPDDVINDGPCFLSTSSSSSGIAGITSSGDSLCSATQWDVTAAVQDATANTTGASVRLHQGVSKRISTGDTPC